MRSVRLIEQEGERSYFTAREPKALAKLYADR